MVGPIVETTLTDGVLRITLNRPEVRNALSIALSHELVRAWERAAEADVRAVVVTGAGPAFCAGADLRDARVGDVATEGLRVTYHPVVLGLVALEKPVIAAVNGAAAGAGLALVFGADLRVASPDAALVPAFSAIGLVPDTGVGFLAGRVLGEAAAMTWLASGRRLSAAEASARGAVDEIADDPVARAQEIAAGLAAVPGRAYGLTKRMFWAQARAGLLANLDLETELQQLAAADPERAAARARVVSELAAKAAEGNKG